MLLGGLFVFTSFHNLEELWLSFAFCLCLYGYIILMCMLCFMVWTFIFWTISSSREIELAKFILFCTTALNSFHYLRPFSLASEGNVFLQSQFTTASHFMIYYTREEGKKNLSTYFVGFLNLKQEWKNQGLITKFSPLLSWFHEFFPCFKNFADFALLLNKRSFS